MHHIEQSLFINYCGQEAQRKKTKGLTYHLPPKRNKIEKSGDDTLLEIRFEVFLKIFVHF